MTHRISTADADLHLYKFQPAKEPKLYQLQIKNK